LTDHLNVPLAWLKQSVNAQAIFFQLHLLLKPMFKLF